MSFQDGCRNFILRAFPLFVNDFSISHQTYEVLNNSDVSYDLYAGLRMLFASRGILISMIVFGIGMILGSLLGMRNAWAEILA
jgi:hypothetical protein